ncbi:hypothetical protein [Mesoplasma melaleucae]|uniref:Uncharacterized protein n=1 Tax=Mesoplasma melaleucae TaxID=81459 RepID=A0A2K8NZJ9_9MOLU|nr:hypothetical protein [Mesoplasma melaleucae]ATZ18063.1 hypothetical protein EMELA_v1c05280 [Mesoplasma melaleucae]
MINNQIMNLNVNKEDKEYLLSILLEDSSLPSDKKLILSASIIKTELGKVIVICDQKNIYLLEFLNKKNLVKRIIKFKTDTNTKITIEKIIQL